MADVSTKVAPDIVTCDACPVLCRIRAGQTEDLHNYVMPTIGDVPPITSIIIEDPEPTGPWGAKGIGEPALIPTAPAILGAIQHATGVSPRELPVTPHRLREAICAARREGSHG